MRVESIHFYVNYSHSKKRINVTDNPLYTVNHIDIFKNLIHRFDQIFFVYSFINMYSLE